MLWERNGLHHWPKSSVEQSCGAGIILTGYGKKNLHKFTQKIGFCKIKQDNFTFIKVYLRVPIFISIGVIIYLNDKNCQNSFTSERPSHTKIARSQFIFTVSGSRKKNPAPAGSTIGWSDFDFFWWDRRRHLTKVQIQIFGAQGKVFNFKKIQGA